MISTALSAATIFTKPDSHKLHSNASMTCKSDSSDFHSVNQADTRDKIVIGGWQGNSKRRGKKLVRKYTEKKQKRKRSEVN